MCTTSRSDPSNTSRFNELLLPSVLSDISITDILAQLYAITNDDFNPVILSQTELIIIFQAKFRGRTAKPFPKTPVYKES